LSDGNREQQAEALIAKMKAARGYMYPEWEFAARQDPEFVAAYNRLYELSLGEGQHVSAKVREFVAIALLGLAIWYLIRGRISAGLLSAAFGVLVFVWYAVTEDVPRQFIFITPYVATLLVLAVASQRLRPPAADGLPYRRGQQTS